MNDTQMFNLEKIKELTNPIEDLQVTMNQLNEYSLKITKNAEFIEKEIINQNFLSQLATIRELMQNLNNILNKISMINLNRFLDFQDRLLIKYKEIFKDNLKKLNITKDITKKIGLTLVENKQVSKIIDFVSFAPSIEITQWLEILDSLKHNTIFLKVIEKTNKYYEKLIQIKLEKELIRIPEDIDPNLITDYENHFRENPSLTFKEFLQTLERKLTQQELSAKKAITEMAKEKEEIERLKQKQEEQKTSYENYLKLSDKEFERLRRKKTREKLINISKISNDNNSIEISNEVSEKIKKFKSQFEKSFEDKYMIQKDEDKDPIDLIRDRKKRKEKEYKQYKNHFKN